MQFSCPKWPRTLWAWCFFNFIKYGELAFRIVTTAPELAATPAALHHFAIFTLWAVEVGNGPFDVFAFWVSRAGGKGAILAAHHPQLFTTLWAFLIKYLWFFSLLPVRGCHLHAV